MNIQQSDLFQTLSGINIVSSHRCLSATAVVKAPAGANSDEAGSFFRGEAGRHSDIIPATVPI